MPSKCFYRMKRTSRMLWWQDIYWQYFARTTNFLPDTGLDRNFSAGTEKKRPCRRTCTESLPRLSPEAQMVDLKVLWNQLSSKSHCLM
ncbi:unnamed protein product [Acanthoscelides obtectus]|uniref:Uncharacterized protein n=1 Tax=Acanthoscelides obtectus TaxID=200917 RepID=A0A9P0NWJ9_ACAOB|nr:unnamed protein product [Acanthoscelides obtectus]CAK1652983.1 hypothetical protein AOBTE_LOCUS17995 [Acanthoscelides obtectus]